MMLSVQQRFILDALRKLGCIRRAQLLVLTREKFRRDDLVISEKRLDAMLRQLRYGMGGLFAWRVIWSSSPKSRRTRSGWRP